MILFVVLFSTTAALAANEVPQTFTLDGKLYVAGTTTPLQDASAKINIQIIDPTGRCVLYEEEQTVNTVTSEGYFHINVGSDTGAGKRTVNDPGRTMAQIFQNTTAISANNVSGQTCPGASYTPAAGAVRYFRVTVTPTSGAPDVLTPDIVIDSAPSAIVAQSVQGLERASILQVNNSGSTVLTQANLEAVFTTPAYTNLQSILAGNFIKTDSSGATLPSYAANPPGTSNGDIWFDSTTGEIKYQNGSGVQTIGTGSSGISSLTVGSSMSINGTVAGTISGGSGTIDLTNTGVGAGTYTKVTVDTKGRVTAGTVSLSESDIPNLTTAGKVSGNTITSGTISGSAGINTSGNLITTGTVSGLTVQATNLRVYNGSNYIQMTAPALGGNVNLTLPADDGNAGEVLSTNGSGVLSWVPSNASTLAGDVSGSFAAASVDKIKGKSISAATADGQIMIYNGTAWVNNVVSGDASLANTGTLTLNTVSVAKGGTGATSFAANAVIVSNGTGSALQALNCTSGQVITFDASGYAICGAGGGSGFVNGGNSFGADATLGTNDNYALNFEVNNTTAMTISNNGNVGIGTSSPSFKLSLSGTATSDRKIGINDTQVVYLPDQTNFTGSLLIGDGGGSLSHTSGAEGYSNTGVGIGALTSNTTGYQNTAIGRMALTSNTTGANNTANGAFALYSNTTGNYNTATGFQALNANTTGSNNTANGHQALSANTTGSFNTANGHLALSSNTTGSGNAANGMNALRSNRTKSESTAIGYNSMYFADDVSAAPVVSYNTAIGAYSLQGSTTAANNTGTQNTALGHSALKNMTSGSGNIGVGYNAGSLITTGSYNVVIGSNTGSSIATASNTVLIADGQGNERMRIDNAGNVGIGTTAPSSALDVSGAINWIGISAPAVSASNEGKIYYDRTANKFKVSQNGAAYVDLVGGGGSSSLAGDVSGASGSNVVEKIQGKAITAASADKQIMIYNGTAWVNSVVSGDATLANDGTLTVDSGTTASKLVRLDGSARLPAVDGSQLTNITATSISGTVPVSKGGTAATSFAANAVIVSNGTGSALQALNCTSGQVITFDASGYAICGAGGSTGFVNGGNSFGAAATLGTNDNYALNFEVNNTTALTISQNGYVGIGNTGPSYPLSVTGGAGAAWTQGVAELSSSLANPFLRLINTTAGGRNWGITSSGTGGLSPGNFVIADLTANQQRLQIDSSGHMRLGSLTSSGSASPTHFNLGGTFSSTAGANPKLKLYDDGTYVYGFGVGPGSDLDYMVPSGSHHIFYIAGAQKMILKSTGNLGIGTDTTPDATIEVGGTLMVSSADNGDGDRFIVNSSGNVGIGRNSPSTALDVSGAFNLNGIAAPAVSASNEGRIYYDRTANKFKVSENGAVYADLVGGGGSSTLAGDVSGASGSNVVEKIQGKAITAASADKQIMIYNGTSWANSVVSGDATLSNTGTLTVDSGSTANKLVRLDGSARLPAVDGSQLTNISVTASNISGTVPVSKGGTAATSFAANAVIVSNGTGSALQALNCTVGQVITFDASGYAICGAGGFTNGGNSLGADATLGTNDGYALNFETNNTTAMTISQGGNVGIGTTAPLAKLHVQGAAVSKPVVIASGNAVDLSLSNVFRLKSVGGSTIALSNLVDGGSYTLIVSDTSQRTYSFTGCTNTYFSPTNAQTFQMSTFSILVSVDGGNTDCFISWQTGFN